MRDGVGEGESVGSMVRENSLPVRVLPMCWGSQFTQVGGREGLCYLVRDQSSLDRLFGLRYQA